MLTLALEFSSPVRSAALLRRHAEQGGGEVMASVTDGGSRALTGLALVDRVLHEAGVEAGAVEAAIVGLGPGSYTGIRSAIAIAQGWQLARDIRLQGVSTVECLALAAQVSGLFGRVSLAIDAQRGDVYLATYKIDAARREV